MLIEERGSNCGSTRTATGEPPTQPQLPPYIRPRTSSPNKLQVCRGGAQPQEKRINQISTTGDKKNTNTHKIGTTKL